MGLGAWEPAVDGAQRAEGPVVIVLVRRMEAVEEDHPGDELLGGRKAVDAHGKLLATYGPRSEKPCLR